jgi:hypothetical protein
MGPFKPLFDEPVALNSLAAVGTLAFSSATDVAALTWGITAKNQQQASALTV